MTNDTFALTDETPKQNENLTEIFPLVDPEQVTKELTEQFVEMQENMPPADVAAHFFKMYHPIYKQLLSGLSNKDARRVAEHVVQWPLEVQYPKFNDDKAEQAFQVGVRLLDCKFIMKSVVEMERIANAQAAKATADAEKQTNSEIISDRTIEETKAISERNEEERTAFAVQGEVTNG